MANEYDWLGPLAGAVGVGVGAAGAVMAGAWKFLKQLAHGRVAEEMRVLENRLLVLETQAKEERELATRDRREMRELAEGNREELLGMLRQVFDKANETNVKVERVMALMEKGRRG